MKFIAIIISGLALAMTGIHWGTPLAWAWLVAFCGWVPHSFPADEGVHGNS
jgi:hypothetical protein